MAMTPEQKTDAYQFFIIAFNAVPGVEFMNQLNDAYEAGMTTQEIVNVYTTKPEFEAIYPRFLSDAQFADRLIETVVGSNATAEAKAAAKADVEGALNAGWTKGDIIYQIFSNLAAKDPADPEWGATATMLANKVEVARYLTETALLSSTDMAVLSAPLQGVTADPATVDAAISGSSGSGAGATSFTLSAGQDGITGTFNDDTFKANVVQNAFGAQVNSLGSGDEIDGGAGNDTLNAKITSGVFAGGGVTMPIQPEITSVENINLQAVIADIGGSISGVGSGLGLGSTSYGNNDVVYFNAKDVVGAQKIASNYSDASLVIQNLTSKGSNHVSEMTIGMEYTGNADHMWRESDLSVYFDQDYLTTQRLLSRPGVDIQVMNEDGYDETDGTLPLAGVFFRELTFTLNGVRYDLTPYLGEDPEGAGTEIQTYAEALTAISDALAQLKADNPTDAALQSMQAELGSIFHADRNPDTLLLREGTSIRLTVEGITNGTDNELMIRQTDLELARAAEATVENNNRFERADNEPPAEDSTLSINVDLEKVGLAGDGGQLIIGSMNKTADNEWGAVSTVTDTVSGFQEFDVTVHGTNDKSSSLAGLHSTNNNLRTVIIDSEGGSATGGWADLTIGNSNTARNVFLSEPDFDFDFGDLGDFGGFLGGLLSPIFATEVWNSINNVPSLVNQNALKDVQTLDASAFQGDLSVWAALTEEVGGKYLNRTDAAPNPAADDNVAFQYTGGVGDDYFNVAISSANFEGTGPATREDWSFKLDGGAGDDELVVGMVHEHRMGEDETDLDALSLGEDGWGSELNWYANQKLMHNVEINGGDGNDVIRSMGSGDYTLNGGNGNDTIYVDNTGRKAVWSLNTAGGDLDDLLSDLNHTYQTWTGMKIRVSYHGHESVVDLAHVNGQSDDLAINQAVKAAINGHPVLGELLIAEDGPGYSLVVTSRIDGRHESSGVMLEDLHGISVTMVPPTTMTAGEAQALSAAWGTSHSPESALGALGVQAAAFNMGTTYSIQNQVAGTWSNHIQDSIITGGPGNDVLVLGTGENSNDTIVYTGFNNGTDSVVHFDVGNTDGMWVGNPGSKESFTITFADLTLSDPAIPTEITVDGEMVTLVLGAGGSLIPAEDVAYEFANQWSNPDWDVVYEPGTSLVTFTATANGNVDDVTEVTFNANVTNGASAATIGDYVQGVDGYVAPNWEEFTVDFNGSVVLVDGSFTYDGVTVNYVVGDGPIELASKVMDAFSGNANWTVTNDELGKLTFVATTAEERADATPEAFGDGAMSPGEGEEVSVTYTVPAGPPAGAGAGGILVNGGLVTLVGGETAEEVAALVAANPATLPAGWTVVDNGDGSLTYTSLVVGEMDEATIFTLDAGATGVTQVVAEDVNHVDPAVVLNGITAVVDIEEQGVAESGELIFVSDSSGGIDFVDYSAYDAVQVLVDQALSADLDFGMPAAVGQKYITMVESATNAGEYTTTLWQADSAADVNLGLIGVLDFGDTMDFNPTNFIGFGPV